jgi:hypothetical protein
MDKQFPAVAWLNDGDADTILVFPWGDLSDFYEVPRGSYFVLTFDTNGKPHSTAKVVTKDAFEAFFTPTDDFKTQVYVPKVIGCDKWGNVVEL